MDYTPSELQDFFCFSVCPRKKEKPISLKGVKPEQILTIKILIWRIPFRLYAFDVTGLFYFLPEKRKRNLYHKSASEERNTK